MITMRRATAEDALEIAELENLIFPDNSFNETTLAMEIEAGICWVYQTGGHIQGYLLAKYDGKLLDILRLGVHPKYQDRGVGTRLLEASLRETGSLMLTVKKDNQKAMKLYHRYGFRIVGELAGEYGDGPDGWVMKRGG